MLSRPVVVVLAAGRGSRFAAPGHKLQQRFGASTVLGCTLRNAIRSGLPLVLVTTDALLDLALPLVAQRDIVVLPEVGSIDPAQPLGMGCSIAAGVGARPHAGGWLVLPGDMPLIEPRTLLAVADALPSHPVAYAQHRGRQGHPVAFAAELYSELVMLGGDEGARRLVARYPAYGVEVADGGVLMDLDTEADLHRLRSADGHDASASMS